MAAIELEARSPLAGRLARVEVSTVAEGALTTSFGTWFLRTATGPVPFRRGPYEGEVPHGPSGAATYRKRLAVDRAHASREASLHQVRPRSSMDRKRRDGSFSVSLGRGTRSPDEPSACRCPWPGIVDQVLMDHRCQPSHMTRAPPIDHGLNSPHLDWHPASVVAIRTVWGGTVQEESGQTLCKRVRDNRKAPPNRLCGARSTGVQLYDW